MTADGPRLTLITRAQCHLCDVARQALARVAADTGEVSVEEHRRDFHRPISAYYAQLLGRPISQDDFATLDQVFHDVYRAGLAQCRLAPDALTALGSWTVSQSLLSMFFHRDLVPVVTR